MNKPNFYRFGRIKYRNPHRIRVVHKRCSEPMLAHFVNGKLDNIWGSGSKTTREPHGIPPMSVLRLKQHIRATYVLPAMRMPGRPSIKLFECKVKPPLRFSKGFFLFRGVNRWGVQS